jgi:hypothetical protein
MTIERTDLANQEYEARRRARAAKPSFRARMAKLLAEDPEGCECAVCVHNWEELG